MCKKWFKNVQIWVRTFCPRRIKNEIAGLRQFLPRRHLLGFFLAIFCMGLWSSLGASWAALGFLEALLGGLWTQKRVKTLGFLRFLKRLFKAHDGPLGLILVSLVNLFGILCKNPGPFWVPKVNRLIFKIALKQGSKKAATKKTWTIFGSFFEHFWALYWGPFWDQIGQRGGKMSPREPSGFQRAKKLHLQKA